MTNRESGNPAGVYRAVLEVKDPRCWVTQVPTRYGFRMTVLSRTINGPGSVTDAASIRAVHHEAGTVAQVLRGLPTVSAVEVVPVGSGQLLGFVGCRGCSACSVASASGCFVISLTSSGAGALRTVLIARNGRALSELLDALRKHGCAAAIVDLRRASVHETLSGRQRQVLETALSIGFFDEPRHAQLRDVARILRISRPSAREILRRAVLRVLRNGSLLDFVPGIPPQPSQERRGGGLR